MELLLLLLLLLHLESFVWCWYHDFTVIIWCHADDTTISPSQLMPPLWDALLLLLSDSCFAHKWGRPIWSRTECRTSLVFCLQNYMMIQLLLHNQQSTWWIAKHQSTTTFSSSQSGISMMICNTSINNSSCLFTIRNEHGHLQNIIQQQQQQLQLLFNQ